MYLATYAHVATCYNAYITATPLLRPQMASPKGGRNRGVLLYIYILTKSEFISSCSQPAVGSNIVQITRTTFFVNVFKKMAAGSHFGCPKITLYRISYHFRSIPQFLFCEVFLQNGCRRPFWMSENHFWSDFWPFQTNMQLFILFFLQNGCRRSCWMSKINFGSHFWLF